MIKNYRRKWTKSEIKKTQRYIANNFVRKSR